METREKLLNIEQMYRYSKHLLSVLKDVGTQCKPTGFAVLNGAFINHDNGCSVWSESNDGYGGVRAVNSNGDEMAFYGRPLAYLRRVAARPVSPFSAISHLLVQSTSSLFLERIADGEYPQTIVDKELNKELEFNFNNGNLRNGLISTGKTFVMDGQKSSESNKPMAEKHLPMFEYGEKRYVRVIANMSKKSRTLIYGNTYKDGEIWWVEVEPRVRLIDREAKIALDAFAHIGGIKFSDERYDGNFEKTNMYDFLNSRGYWAGIGFSEQTQNGGIALTRREIPQGLPEIAENAFAGCSHLKEIVIPASITKIGKGAFDCCSFKYLTIEENKKILSADKVNGNSVEIELLKQHYQDDALETLILEQTLEQIARALIKIRAEQEKLEQAEKTRRDLITLIRIRQEKNKEFAPRYNEIETQDAIIKLISLNKRTFEISSYEWERVYSAIRNVAKETGQKVWIFDVDKGVREFGEAKMINVNEHATTLKQAIDDFNNAEEPIIMIINGFDEGTEITTSINLAMIANTMRDYNYSTEQTKQKNLVLYSQSSFVPKELREELPVVEIKLPDENLLMQVAKRATAEMSIKETDIHLPTIKAALGLTTMQAEEAFKNALFTNEKLSENEIKYVVKQKESIINRSGVLECIHPNINLDDVGGLENLKDYVKEAKVCFSDEAKEFGIPTPKGILLVGVPGTGKSMTAKAIASHYEMPLIKCDIGKVFGSLVGESEKNMRYALDVAESAAPCVLWIDEIEKGLSGIESSGRSDGGTGSRVFGKFLTWMQEKEKPVFVVATANDISKLPPEFLRKGRFDEIFAIDLPTAEERLQIMKAGLKRVKKQNKNAVLLQEKVIKKVIDETEGFTGAELDSIISESMKKAFMQKDVLTLDHLLSTIPSIVPSSITMADRIEVIRKECKHFRPASKKEVKL